MTSKAEQAAGHYAAERQMKIYPELPACDELRMRGWFESAYIDGFRAVVAEAEKWCNTETLTGSENPRYRGEMPSFRLIEDLKLLLED